MRGSRSDITLGDLTDAERRVGELVGSGATNKAVAHALGVSVKTVEFHLSNVYRKLDVRTRHELIRLVTTASIRPTSRTLTFVAVSVDERDSSTELTVGDAAAARTIALQHLVAGGGQVVASVSPSVVASFDSATDALRVALALIGEDGNDGLVAGVALHTGIAGDADAERTEAEKSLRVASMAQPGQAVLSTAAAGLLADSVNAVLVGLRDTGGGHHEPLYLAAGPMTAKLADRQDHIGNVPSPQALVGRTAELTELSALLRGRRLITIVGPGGVGKTALAIAAAAADRHAWREGCWFVDLSAISSSPDAPAATAAALGVLSTKAHMEANDIAELVGTQQRLIVLDNCEHVLDAASAIAAAFLLTCPNTAVLATSRERLDLPDERLLRLSPIDATADRGSSAAATLFTMRARDVDNTFDPDGRDLGTIDALCERLDGLPLAIELAAARMATYTLDDVAAGLATSHRLLTRRRIGGQRHRSLDAAIRWSYDLLDTNERTCLHALAVFPGDFDAHAATAVISALDPNITFDEVTSLVERSLVQASVTSPRRYRLLDTIRTFARGENREAGSVSTIRRAHFTHYLDMVATADDNIRHVEEATGHRRFVDEWHNLRAAVHTACDLGLIADGCRLVERTLWWAMTRYRVEIGAWAAALDHTAAGDGAELDDLDAVPLVAAQLFAAIVTEDAAVTSTLSERARRLDTTTCDRAEPWLPCIAVFTSAGEELLGHATDVQRRAQRHDDLFWEMVGALEEGTYRAEAYAAGITNADTELPRIRECVALAEQLDNPNGLAYAARVLGSALSRTEPDQARDLLQRSLDLAEPLQLELLIPQSLLELSRVEHTLGDPVAAIGHIVDTIALRHRTGAHVDLIYDIASAAHAFADLGDDELAARCAGFTIATRPGLEQWLDLTPLLADLRNALGGRRFDQLVTDAVDAGIEDLVARIVAATHDLPGRSPARTMPSRSARRPSSTPTVQTPAVSE